MIKKTAIRRHGSTAFGVKKEQPKGDIIGFAMGMRYLPSISPLTSEFFAETTTECPAFFEIFTKTMPLMMKSGIITDATMEEVLNGRKVYYLGMTGFRDQEVAGRLAGEIAEQVFAKDKQFSAVYTLSSSSHESQMAQLIASQKMGGLNLCLNRFGATQENPDIFIALVYPIEDQIARKYVHLFENI